MKITFYNDTQSSVCIGTGDTEISVYPMMSVILDLEEGEQEISLRPQIGSSLVYFSKKLGFIRRRYFSVSSLYGFDVHCECVVTLRERKKRGGYMDEYCKIEAYSSECCPRILSYSVWDADRIQYMFNDSVRKGNNIIRTFNAFDIIGNGLTALLILLIPFAFIWLFWDFDLAARICGIAFIPIMGLIILADRLFDKMWRILWKKGKKIALLNKPFKGNHSYFDSEYISFVFDR